MATTTKFSLFTFFFIYIFVFAPDIKLLPVPSPLLLLPITYYIFIVDKKIFSQYVRLFKAELLCLFFLLIYVFFLDFTYGKNVYLTHVLYYIFEVFPTSLFIVSFLCKGMNRVSFFKTLIFVGTIASTISVISLFVPIINEILTSLLKGNAITDPYSGRNYGFASGFLYAYPIGLGIFGVLTLIMIQKNKFYIINFALILVSIIINARTGLLPIILYLLYSFLKFNFKTIIFTVLFISSFTIANNLGFFSKYQEIIDWNLSMFYDISNHFFGTNLGKYGNSYTWFNFIVDNFLVFPESINDWIFGEHREIFLDPKKNSDIGYINDLIYGGLILVFFITLFFIIISRKIYQIKDKDIRIFAFLFFFVYLIVNIKGEFFRPNVGNRVMILIYVYLIYNYFCTKPDFSKNHGSLNCSPLDTRST